MNPLMITLCGGLLAGALQAARLVPAQSPEQAPRNQVLTNGAVRSAGGSPAPPASRDQREACDFAFELSCNAVYTGSSADSQNGDLWNAYCFSGESAPEVIHVLDHPGGLLNITLDSPDSEQLDLILLGSCDPADCLAMPWLVGSFETISGGYAAGTYYVIVDGYNWDGQPFTYSLDVQCLGNQDFCENAIPLSCGETMSGSSADSQNGNTWTGYCFSGETGAEVIYSLEHPGGFLALDLSSTDSEQLDLVLLGSCDPADCLEMPWLIGSSESISGDYAAGTYYVVVDAYNWDGQPFTFELDVSCPGVFDPCEFALPLSCGETISGSSEHSQNGNLWSGYCFTGETGPEVLYAFDHPGGLLHLELDSQDSAQLDLILLGSCDPADCLAMPWLIGSSESISGVWPAGRYYVVVDAFLWDDQPFTFTLRADCPGEDALCHHESTGLLLALPDPLESALSYLQLFIPGEDASLQSVLLHVDTDSEPQHEGTLTLAVHEPGLDDYPGVLVGALDFDAGALGDGYMELDMSPLGYQITAFQDYVIRLDFAPAGPGDRLGFFAGSLGGYDEYSSFYNGESYTNWWGNGEEFNDELNLCVTTGTPCEAVDLAIETVGTNAVLSWTPVAGTLHIRNGMEAYEQGALLVEVDAMAGSYTHTGGVTLGRQFYQALHLCD